MGSGFLISKLLHFCEGGQKQNDNCKNTSRCVEGGAALETQKDTMTPTSVYQDHHSLTGDTATAQPLPRSSPAQSWPIGRGHKAPMQSRRLGGVARHIAIVIDAIVTAVTIALVRLLLHQLLHFGFLGSSFFLHKIDTLVHKNKSDAIVKCNS